MIWYIIVVMVWQQFSYNNNNWIKTFWFDSKFSLYFTDCLSLRIVRFEVPSAVAKGQPVVLHCNYDLEGDELYSVKYYKDYVEFYRYLPNDEPRAAQKFKLKGAYVDVSYSTLEIYFFPIKLLIPAEKINPILSPYSSLALKAIE